MVGERNVSEGKVEVVAGKDVREGAEGKRARAGGWVEVGHSVPDRSRSTAVHRI